MQNSAALLLEGDIMSVQKAASEPKEESKQDLGSEKSKNSPQLII